MLGRRYGYFKRTTRNDNKTSPRTLSPFLALGVTISRGTGLFFLEHHMDKQEWINSFKDPRWQQTRLRIMERDEWACVMCGNKKTTLNIHHSYYNFNDDWYPWEYPDYSLYTLCEHCHEVETCLKKEALKCVSDFFRSLPFLSSDITAIFGVLQDPYVLEFLKRAGKNKDLEVELIQMGMALVSDERRGKCQNDL